MPDDQFLIATEMGAFRIAYHPKTGAQALFYARHPDDLAGERVADPANPKRTRLKIKYPERITLLEIKNRRHSDDIAFGPYDGKRHLDCSSILKRVYDAAQYIPRINQREAAFHKMGGAYYSAHVGYHPGDRDRNGLTEIEISTRIHTDFGFNTTTPGLMRRMDRRTRELLRLKRHAPVVRLTFALNENGDGEEVEQIPPSQIVPAILADAQKRVDALYVGEDPSKFDGKLVLGAERLAETIGLEAKHIGHEFSTFRRAARATTEWGIGLLHLPYTAGKMLVDNVFADPKISEYIPENWHHIIETRRHVIPVISEMNQFMQRVKPDAVGDFEWLSPDRHHPNFVEDVALQPANADAHFKKWLVSHFLAPYCAAVEYFGTFDDFSQMHNMTDVKLIRSAVNNGLNLFYDCEDKKLYAYYSPESIDPLKRHLPANAASYLKDGEVLVCNMADYAAPLATLPFVRFEAMLQQHGYAREELRLVRPRQPDITVLNHEPGNGAAATPRQQPQP